LLVVIGICLILLSILVPVVLRQREQSRRAGCVNQLRAIRDGLLAYATDNGNNFPRVRYDEAVEPHSYTAYTGPDAADPFADESAVALNDVTASLWLLARGHYVKDTAIFICPSTSDWADQLKDAAGQRVDVKQRSNFRSERNLSYSYASPFSNARSYRLNIDNPSNFALLADKNPGKSATHDVTAVAPDAHPFDMVRANSLNHGGAGQNVLYAQGEVVFKRAPYAGVDYDNIYTVLSQTPLSGEESTTDFYVPGYFGKEFGPSHASDSYLVPGANDVAK
jgi:type II secretory pathway pseudopilin PulG